MMRIALNERGSFGFSKKLKMSFTGFPSVRLGYSFRESGSGSDLVGDFARERGEAGGDRRSALLRTARRGRVLDELDVQAQRLELLAQHVERLRQAGFEHVLALDDRLVHPGAAQDVV